jgi:hypothetical protein
MRLAPVTALGLFAVGALLTWATDGVVGGADTIGVILMIAGGAGSLALVLLSASRDAAAWRGVPCESIDEPDDRLTARWSRR